MKSPANPNEADRYLKLKWLMFFRLLFTCFLLGSTILLHWRESPSPTSTPLMALYLLVGGIFVLSCLYAVVLPRISRLRWFAFLQLGIDTVIVTLIIFVTGNYSSVFSFLYLVVIIYSSILLDRQGGMLVAALSSFQYCVVIALEYQGVLSPMVFESGSMIARMALSHVLYKVIITTVACFAVAFLGGLLSEQAVKSRKELADMEDHVRRVEKMAFMGEMAAGLAHEIKNPLASLAGSIQMLKEEIQYNPDHDRLMHIVLRETDRLSALVNNFLLFARPPSGSVQTIQLDAALSEIVALFEKDRTIFGKISIDKTLLPDLQISIDPLHLRQVVWNLLLNAAEAIETTGRIDITMLNHRKSHVGVAIKDNGRGIPRAIRTQMFNPFFTTKKVGQWDWVRALHRSPNSRYVRLPPEHREPRG